MKTITLEEHFSTSKVMEAGKNSRRPDAAMAAFLESVAPKLLDVGAGRVAVMDRDGISHQVLSLAGGGLDHFEPDLACELAHETNLAAAAAVKAYPDRFSAFAALPMTRPEKAARELEECVQRHGFKGALVDGTVNGVFLDDVRFLPVFEAAASLGVPIYLHPAPPPPAVYNAYFADLKPPLNSLLATAGWGWHVETGLHVLRLISSGLFDRLPSLKMIIGHMGENLPFSIVRAENVLSRGHLPLKRKVTEYFRENFWITTSGYFSLPPLLCACQVLGAERILLSVDYPFSEMSNAGRLLELMKAEFTEEEVEKIAWKNSAELLGIGLPR